MIRKVATLAVLGAVAIGMTGCSNTEEPATAEGKGTIAVIAVDLASPYERVLVDAAEAEIEKAGYTATINAHKLDPDKENQLIDSAISNKVKAIILDPAGAEVSIAAVQKATDADIPVFVLNAEIAEQGIAKSQIVSNNAQGSLLGAEAWVEAMGGEGKYVELVGPPTDNNAKVRSDGYASIIDGYPGLEKVGEETANWLRGLAKEKMEGLIAANPDITGVISGNDEMALGAIEALTQAGMIDRVKVLAFDGSVDAVEAVKNGTLVATVLQPVLGVVEATVAQAVSYIETGETGVSEEKQSIDCMLITKENADKYVSAFVLDEN
ncbi:D-ribose ABC transporter substrate-binding protein [Lysinibacter cavernae]|uniref:Erythritol transport system substrate-binding protein n=1 Tax=Lysinibacter cavernae TaxID=1640652 RepID=A0A7X5TTW0_9MICO|nr:D-ribose ABC transporter substrate-binding protein [Lysinibacter cavernae]NIH55041.1 erythritol transport system substrate-binding protein [Lysinibacter cavernae]